MVAIGITSIYRSAGWLALAYTLAVAGFMFWNASQESDGMAFLMSLLIIPWVALPVIVASVLAALSETRRSAALFLALEAGFVASVVLLIGDYTYFHPSSTGGIALLIWPLYQLAAIVVLCLIACLFGWRPRPDFMKMSPAPGLGPTPNG